MVLLDLDRFYSYFPWHMRSDDERAKVRFENLLNFFDFLLEEIEFDLERVHVLELMGGTGIAGVAFSKVLENRGSKVSLLVTDLRPSDLEDTHNWKEIAKLEAPVETRVLDVRKLDELDGSFDVILIWGLSTPHLSPDDMIDLLKASREKTRGYLILEEMDRVFRILYSGYKDVLKEDDVISIHSGYDRRTGMFMRDFYSLPGFEEIAAMKMRFWDTPVVKAICRAFFEDVRVFWEFEHRFPGVKDVIVCRK